MAIISPLYAETYWQGEWETVVSPNEKFGVGIEDCDSNGKCGVELFGFDAKGEITCNTRTASEASNSSHLTVEMEPSHCSIEFRPSTPPKNPPRIVLHFVKGGPPCGSPGCSPLPTEGREFTLISKQNFPQSARNVEFCHGQLSRAAQFWCTSEEVNDWENEANPIPDNRPYDTELKTRWLKETLGKCENDKTLGPCIRQRYRLKGKEIKIRQAKEEAADKVAFANGTNPNGVRETRASVSLEGGGEVAFLINKQFLGKQCSAVRSWLKVKGCPGASKINAVLREELTVGKKLTRKHCGNAKNPETTEYLNTAELTGKRKNIIGVETRVHYSGSGRTGTHIMKCSVFDLTSGERVDLGKYLTDAGKVSIASAICGDGAQKALNQKCETFEQIESHLYYGFRYCLRDKGVAVNFNFGNSGPIEEVILGEEQISSAFNWAPLSGNPRR